MTDTAHIGLIGLGVMGRSLALNIADHGFRVAIHNRTPEVTRTVLDAAGALQPNLIGCDTTKALVDHLARPRVVLLMVKAGDAVDASIKNILPLLSSGDILIDGGNANFHDTRRRHTTVTEAGLQYLGAGVSGGEEGARYGPAIMVGGSADAYDMVAPILLAIAAQAGNAEPCCAHLGPDGAGHFVKTMHNGIEYADMQMIAEVYHLMRHGLGLEPPAIGDIVRRWNEGPLASYLTEITADILMTVDPETDAPLVDMILDTAGEKGTGRWAVTEAIELGVPVPTLCEAVAARALSARKAERVAAEEMWPRRSARIDNDTAAMLSALEGALLVGRIAAFAQGFAVMSAASRHYDWQLRLDTVARIWRGGCILRSSLLEAIARAYVQAPDLANFLVDDDILATVQQRRADLQSATALAAGTRLPAPALMSALAYVDGYFRSRLWADLIQAQRDYFGAHTFERTDRPGAHHFDWNAARE